MAYRGVDGNGGVPRITVMYTETNVGHGGLMAYRGMDRNRGVPMRRNAVKKKSEFLACTEAAVRQPTNNINRQEQRKKRRMQGSDM